MGWTPASCRKPGYEAFLIAELYKSLRGDSVDRCFHHTLSQAIIALLVCSFVVSSNSSSDPLVLHPIRFAVS